MIFLQVICRNRGRHHQNKCKRAGLRPDAICSRAGSSSMILQTRRALAWAVLLFLLTLVSYVSFRAYLSPEFLIGFANLFTC